MSVPVSRVKDKNFGLRITPGHNLGSCISSWSQLSKLISSPSCSQTCTRRASSWVPCQATSSCSKRLPPCPLFAHGWTWRHCPGWAGRICVGLEYSDQVVLWSEVLFPVVKLVLVTLLLEYLAELRWAAEEDGDLSLLLLVDGLEHLVPVGPAGVGARLESSDEVALWLKRSCSLFMLDKVTRLSFKDFEFSILSPNVHHVAFPPCLISK